MNNQINKCAPSKKFTDGSCFTVESLQKIATAYNKKYPDKINVTNQKRQLLRELKSRMENRFDVKNETQWQSTSIVKSLNDKEIKYNTHRPVGPSDLHEWLSTTDIDSVMKQYQEKYPEFHFFGAVPADFEDVPYYGMNNIDFAEFDNKNKYKLGMVINLDKHDEPGSHWVALYTNLRTNTIYYFDSFAKKPTKLSNKFVRKILTYMYNKKNNSNFNVEQFMKKYHSSKDYDVRYNKIQHQFKNSECGVYSMNFIIRLLHSETFDHIVNNITNDDKMNSCIKVYFKNVN
jgi:hypothetical protein